MPLGFKSPEETAPSVALPSLENLPRPAIGEYGPRVVRLKRSAQVGAAVCAGLALSAGLLGGAVVAARNEQAQQLLSAGQVVEGRVTHREVRRGENKSYRLHYEYSLGSQRISDWERVSRSVYEATPEGTQVEVTAVPTRPGLHRFGRFTKADADRELLLGGSMTFVFVLLLGGVAALIRGQARREAAILTDWAGTTGQVLSLKPALKGQNGGTYKLRVRYRVFREAPIETDLKVQRPTKWELAPGDTVQLLVNPENPGQVRPLDGLSMVEIDPGMR